ncbi:MAG: phosphoribosylglycinamide formyltransferase [Christensenellales bacterium]|nr:phosphoribosylglycinamide formyltransferase [Christensenellales bacterium]
MSPVRTAVLVSGGGTNLQAIIDASARGEIPSAEIALVISSKPDVFALERAKKAGIPWEVCPRKGRTQQAFEAGMLDMLSAHNIQLLVLAGFMSILTEDFVRRYPRRIINVHPALIPSFCGKGYYGLRVHEAALEYGVKVTGATVHFVNEIPDGGQIIAQKAVEIVDGDTPEVLQRRVMEQAEWILLPRALEQVASEQLKEDKHNAEPV